VSGSGICWACKSAPHPRQPRQHPTTQLGFTQPLQINDIITLYMLPLIPLHFLCTHFLQLVHCIELLPTPLIQTPHGHLTAFCVTFCHSPLITTLVLFIFTLMPLFSTKSFHSLRLLIRSSSVSAITTRSSGYSNSYGKATLNILIAVQMHVIVQFTKTVQCSTVLIPSPDHIKISKATRGHCLANLSLAF